MRTRRVIVGTTGVVLAMSCTAMAECVVCSPSVRFDETLARCFEASVSDELASIRSGKQIVMINLGVCAETAETRGDALPGPVQEALDFAFVTDEPGLICLKDKLAAAARPLNPTALFEIGAACP